ncbi:hypothetical protein J6590_047550 [Homalodisca vitripennis]|nr:hypothetical protein J6590_047550 [Homalodisca vitripennis]
MTSCGEEVTQDTLKVKGHAELNRSGLIGKPDRTDKSTLPCSPQVWRRGRNFCLSICEIRNVKHSALHSLPPQHYLPNSPERQCRHRLLPSRWRLSVSRARLLRLGSSVIREVDVFHDCVRAVRRR